MAKISLNKLGLNKTVNKEPIIIDFNDEQVEIQQYLPIEKKLELITDIINYSVDENGYYNPCRLEMFLIIETILAYSNISITQNQRKDIFKVYDNLVNSGLASKIIENIPKNEYEYILKSTKETIENIYKYRNSVLGILDTISTDYSNLNLDASTIQKKIADPENLELLKTILTKLG